MSRWLRCYAKQSEPRLRLFCIPFAGGASSAYAQWRLPAELDAEIWGVQLPGRENRWREPRLTRHETVVAALLDELVPLADQPFALFGHSMGALLSFELARALRRDGGAMPVHLFLSACRAPHLPPWRPSVSPLPDAAFLARMHEMAVPLGEPVPATDANDEVLLTLAPMMRADFQLCEAYEYVREEPLDVPITCFAAEQDREVRVDEMTQWRSHTTAEWGLHRYPGGHLYIKDAAPAVLSRIAADLRSLAEISDTRR